MDADPTVTANKLIKFDQEAGGYVWSRMYEHILELATTYPINLAESSLQQYADSCITTRH